MEYGFGSEGWRLLKISRNTLYSRSECGGSVNNFAEQPYARVGSRSGGPYQVLKIDPMQSSAWQPEGGGRKK
jgi:hypothetical protein